MKCSAKKKDGEPCSKVAVARSKGKPVCQIHDPKNPISKGGGLRKGKRAKRAKMMAAKPTLDVRMAAQIGAGLALIIKQAVRDEFRRVYDSAMKEGK